MPILTKKIIPLVKNSLAGLFEIKLFAGRLFSSQLSRVLFAASCFVFVYACIVSNVPPLVERNWCSLNSDA